MQLPHDRTGENHSTGPAAEPHEDEILEWAGHQLEMLRQAIRPDSNVSHLSLLATAELAHNEWRRCVSTVRCSRQRLELDIAAAKEAWRQASSLLELATSRTMDGASDRLIPFCACCDCTPPDVDKVAPIPRTPSGREVTPVMCNENSKSAPNARSAGKVGAPVGVGIERPVPNRALSTFMFGRFQVFTRGVPIETWHGLKPQTAFRHLLARRNHLVPRDILIDQLWPEADAEVGRRNLHQVIYSLRRALRDANIETSGAIIHESDGYRIDEHLDLWIDVVAFEHHVSEGRRRAQAGDVDGAITEFLNAERLYVDDYLTDALYEEWTIAERERLRMSCTDLVERVNVLLFERRRFTDIAALCERRLRADPSAEVGHRWMMRVYAERGQHELVLQQYRYCSEVLQREWGLRPTPETEQLYLALSG